MKRQLLKLIKTLLLSIVVFSGCKNVKLPNIKYIQYEYDKSFSYDDETLIIELKNTLQSPLRIWIFTSNTDLQNQFNQTTPILLESNSDTILTYSNIKNFDEKLSFSSFLGNTSKKIEPIQLDLPFSKNKEYTIIQENNSSFTHNNDWSRYALDFNLKTNDTICSATSGFVVGVIDKYKHSGISKEWKPFANFITIYEPVSGVFCQNVHLAYNGSFLEIGDKVERGQNIGLSGNTGQSTIEHLHFNCLIPVNSKDGLKSIPIEFIGGLISTEIKKGDKVKR